MRICDLVFFSLVEAALGFGHGIFVAPHGTMHSCRCLASDSKILVHHKSIPVTQSQIHACCNSFTTLPSLLDFDTEPVDWQTSLCLQ